MTLFETLLDSKISKYRYEENIARGGDVFVSPKT